ncbi:uncharacterized protein LOC115482956 isoform X2 [Drosophila hydei]|uniref:Uncharacterized protein LOC115482956 isoform X2 n=1 Tax=Drosophila hydei TaxID=7224 RepID=A0A6J2SQE4_DROHY|nr:uncharacterized protein LOC115482956 isoform X2 [Drosophila hydei]
MSKFKWANLSPRRREVHNCSIDPRQQALSAGRACVSRKQRMRQSPCLELYPCVFVCVLSMYILRIRLLRLVRNEDDNRHRQRRGWISRIVQQLRRRAVGRSQFSQCLGLSRLTKQKKRCDRAHTEEKQRQP